MSERDRLERIAARYRWRRRAAAALLLVGALAIGMAAGRFAAGESSRYALAALIALPAAAAGVLSLRRVVDAAVLARHLDRSDPAFEDSAELLLESGERLSIGGRLERARAAHAFAAHPPALARLPDTVARRMALAGTAGLLGAALLAIAPLPGETPAQPAGPAASGAAAVPRVRDLTIAIEPPRYTGRATRRQRAWDLDVEEAARVTWTVSLDRPVRSARLVTSAGDSVDLEPEGPSGVSGSIVARAPALYQIVLDGRGSDYHRLIVRPDAAPSVTVLRPPPRTLIAPDSGRRVAVEVLAQDDHGVRDAVLVATVTSGEGEGVRFRERRLTLGSGAAARGGRVYRRTLDLDSLGMLPGDELYFHAAVHDTRLPSANQGRSETVFIALADTGSMPAAQFGGLALDALPEYFRSQRQIIIDTERLIADAPKLPTGIFRERANAIGMDQGLLRLRYGAFIGEEFEESVEPGAAHQHDSEENATLLAPSTRATLKGAVAQMWEAELRLRTYRPRDALPYEYRALELLKAVQAGSRAYVQRVGFEPPPLEPDRKRLSGELDAIPNRAVSDTVRPAPRLPAVTSALERARALADGRAAQPGDPGTFDRAAAEIARSGVSPAAEQLDAIRAVRALAAALRSRAPCPGCARAAERALARQMPAAPAAATPRTPATPLARRYLELIGRP